MAGMGHKKARAGYRAAGVALFTVGFFMLVTLYIRHAHLALLTPAGPVGQQERHLMVFALLLALIVVVPVFAMAFGFAWRYRASNTKAKYSPELDGSHVAETLWWGIPSLLILILSVVTWNSSHTLDPSKPLTASAQPITVQVVALDWKWLFIYPAQHIATVNYLEIPQQTPINFQITADAPMNSFWIPKLGGQIYAMPGMLTQLHLMASQTGDFPGSSANISGAGFAGMRFMTHAVASNDFAAWVTKTQHAPHQLTLDEYKLLAKPSSNVSPADYSHADANLYNWIMQQYMAPAASNGSMSTMNMEMQ